MNAGAFGDETWPLVEEATLIDRHGDSRVVPGGQFKFGYRTVVLADDQWFLACLLRLKTGDVESSQARIRGLLAKRGSSQPIGQPSCGSVFRNPPGNFAARLIEQCGLKGYTIGKASVSEKHANFIINNGGACADDIEQLINYLKQEVKRKEAVDLITEVCILGETSEEQSAGAQQ